MPGPKNIPFLGNFFNMSAPGIPVKEASHKILTSFDYLWKQHGDIVRIDFPFAAPLILYFSPELAEKVYR